MRALFFIPTPGYYTRGLSNPNGVLSIATYLKQHGHEVKIIDRSIQKGNIKKAIRAFSPAVVGISLMSSRGVKDAVKISSVAKQCGCIVVWGGQMPSMQEDLALQCTDVDYVSLGEGEITWLELLEKIQNGQPVSSVEGIAYRENGKTVLTPCRAFADLRDLPILDYSLIDVQKYMKPNFECKKMMYFYSSKGCPFRCTFCTSSSFHRRTLRKRPVDYVISEIQTLVDQYQLDGAYMTGELWCSNRKDLIEFCDRIRPLGIRWGVQMRIGMFEEEDFLRMYDAGCRWAMFGIESGSKEMLRRIQKEIPYEKIVPTLDFLNRIGITTITSFIIGYPGETADQLRDTVKLMNSIRTGLVAVYHFTPLPGTELYQEVVQSGQYTPPKTLKEASKIIAIESLGTNLSQVPDLDLKVIRSWYNWRAFTGQTASQPSKKSAFAKETILTGLQSIIQNGIFYFLVNGFRALHDFLYVLWYSHMYPKVVRKYSLDTACFTPEELQA